MGSILGGALLHLVIKPFTQPAQYRKYWSMIGTGAAGMAGVGVANQLGVDPQNMEIAIGVLMTIVGNLVGNRT